MHKAAAASLPVRVNPHTVSGVNGLSTCPTRNLVFVELLALGSFTGYRRLPSFLRKAPRDKLGAYQVAAKMDVATVTPLVAVDHEAVFWRNSFPASSASQFVFVENHISNRSDNIIVELWWVNADFAVYLKSQKSGFTIR